MLTVMLLSCALLLALPPTLGVQMRLAPLEGIRRPDQALFPEFPGEYGQGGHVWGEDNCWSQICLFGLSPHSRIPIPTLEVHTWCMVGVALTSSAPGLSLNGPKRTTADRTEEALLQKAEALAEVLDAQNRETRSPRRCVRLHESCLGQQVPCCDPCATCYCRFFNAFCYCRKLGTATNLCSRT
ncbi:agouti-related protein isoform X1 [Cricetulus griseus]|uniref:Agouti-related protein n=1 Tax=Cricetulus griseus TaxID=10029 RepID=A0A9J7GSQ7_CRIGR|nr:agouti-related protein isoform X1 [Cricetulus griseus]XP_035315824.1 agouti-related protein isoform X1 [Cricetulus griseus]